MNQHTTNDKILWQRVALTCKDAVVCLFSNQHNTMYGLYQVIKFPYEKVDFKLSYYV
jgi:hypothetical protein